MPRPSTRPHETRPKDRRSQWVHAEQKWPIRLGQDGRKVIGIKRAMCLTDGSPRITVSANLNPLIAPGAASDRRYDAVHLGRSSRVGEAQNADRHQRTLSQPRRRSLVAVPQTASRCETADRAATMVASCPEPGRTFAGMLTPPSKPPLIGFGRSSVANALDTGFEFARLERPALAGASRRGC